jgi:hypothetical protein
MAKSGAAQLTRPKQSSPQKLKAIRENGTHGGRPVGSKLCPCKRSYLGVRNSSGFCRECRREHDIKWLRKHYHLPYKHLYIRGGNLKSKSAPDTWLPRPDEAGIRALYEEYRVTRKLAPIAARYCRTPRTIAYWFEALGLRLFTPGGKR